MRFCGHRFALLVVCLLLPIATASAESEIAAASGISPAVALADHLDKTRQAADRLQSQIEHPRGRPEARAELAELVAHLGRLQKATAELGGEVGAALEAERAELRDQLRGLGRKDDRQQVEELGGSGSIAGRVTAAGSGLPLANVPVIAYRIGGYYSGSSYTDANGEYHLSSLEDGGYFVGTDLSPYSSAYLNETYQDVYCASYGLCPTADATPVVVAGGAAVGGINFDLFEGGKLRGRVLDQEGLPIAGAYIYAYNSLGNEVSQVMTDLAGRFVVSRLLPGSYYLRAASDRHADELYPDLPCEGGACSILAGLASTVAIDSQVVDLDFILARRGTLRGKVVDAGNEAPISYAQVLVQGSSASRSVYTNDLGEWEIGDLAADTYFARAADWDYQSELYSGIACPGNNCTLTSGTPIVLAEGGTVAAIDFSLDHLGAISGSVRAAVSLDPLSAQVEVFNSQGYYVAGDYGSNFTVDSLGPGNYFVTTRLFFDSEYQEELWQDIVCTLGCTVTAGTPVPVALGQVSSGIDFLLDRLGRIEGRVTASVGGGLADVQVSAYHIATGAWLRTDYTDDQGYFRITGLPPGTYKVRAAGSSYRSELWDGVPCSGECDPAAGQSVAVALASTTAGINFALEQLGSIAGTVRDQATNLPLANQRVEIWTAAGGYVASWYTDENGAYRTYGLPDGSYFTQVRNYSDDEYWSEIWNGFDCRSCPSVTTGTPIAVSVGNSRNDIDFTLLKGGQIQGTVISAATGQNVPSGYVDVYDSNGNYRTYVNLTANGFKVVGLDTGNYFLVADPGPNALVTEVWPNVVCLPNAVCSPLLGMPVAVTVGQVSNANFALDLLGSLAGRIVDAETGAPVGGGYVELYTNSGSYYGSGYVGIDGEYLLVGLGPGDFKLRTSSNSAHIERVYGGAACETTSCNYGSGTALTVAMGQNTVAADLPLAFGPGIAGWVRKEGSAAPGVGIDVWSASGAHLGAVASDAAGRYRMALPAGPYYVTTDNGSSFIDEVFSDVACPDGPAYLGLCDPLDGNPVGVSGGMPATDSIDFDLESPAALFRDGFESGNFSAWSTVIGN